MDIYLIRHGECFESTYAHYDEDKQTMNPPLTPKGVWQAERLAHRCARINFDVIISSDLLRAVQTAERINNACPSEYVTNCAFREIDMGEIHTKTWGSFPEVYSEWVLHNQDIPYPNGESGEDVWKRCKTQLDSIVKTKCKNVAIVCHGGTIRSIVCGVLGMPQQKRFYLGFPVENCSISIIKFAGQEKKFYLHAFNDYSHLSEYSKST